MPNFVTPVGDSLLEVNHCHGAGKGHPCTTGGRTTAKDMLNQMVNYGGIPTRRGDVIKDLQKQGLSQAGIDRYLQKLDFSTRQVHSTIRAQTSVKLRDMEDPKVLGYSLDRATLTPKRARVDTSAPGDHGADPLGDGKFRMVPSGDIVDYEERNRRLDKRKR